MAMDTDVVVLGTGLLQSIVAAALSKAGFKIIHIDNNQYYGGEDASLSVDELVEWAKVREETSTQLGRNLCTAAQQQSVHSVSFSSHLPPNSRQYSISLSPTIIPSVGPLIDSLIASGVARYGGFKLLERVAIFDGPGSDFEGKPEIQGHEATPFLPFLRDVFSLDEKSSRAITYALAFCTSAKDRALPALQRLRRYLRSAGRYGSSPFLVGHYGGLGELSQGFCRTAAVSGGIYILGRDVTSYERLEHPGTPSPPDSDHPPSDNPCLLWNLSLQGFEQDVRCGVIVSSPDRLPHDEKLHSGAPLADARKYSFARGIVIIDTPIYFRSASKTPVDTRSAAVADVEEHDRQTATDVVDTALVVFPPSSVEGGSTVTSVSVLITGEASFSSPKNTWVLHFSLPIPDESGEKTASDLLQPYLAAMLTLVAPSTHEVLKSPLFTMFYFENRTRIDTQEQGQDSVIIADSFSPFLPEVSDQIAIDAERCFWQVVERLKSLGRKPKRKSQSGEEGDNVDYLWPPLGSVGNDDD